MIIYGRNPVREALAGRRGVSQVWATAGAARAPWLAGVGVQSLPGADALERLCGSPDHQGVCAEAGPYPYTGEDDLLGAPEPLILVLDEIQDPQNLGAICRSAETAGATGVVIPERRCAEVTPAVCKASAGAVEHLSIARVRNVSDFLGQARDAGCWSYGAAAEAERSYTAPDYRGGVVMVLGAEGRGLRPRVAASCDQLVSLPIRGRVGSLNVSATTAVLLYEVLRQRAR